mgnify:CR=1 FL=1|jgi:lysozyme family protein
MEKGNSMELFDEALELILIHEGGYIDDPHDRGGETKYGISKRAYPDVDIKNLTTAQAGEIYKRDYWDKCHCSSLPSGIALQVFDTAVNCGISRASKFLQECTNSTPDGIIGQKTLSAVSEAYNSHREHLIQKYTDRREKYYRSLKQYDRYGRGWSRRNKETHEKAMEWTKKS